MQMRLTTPKRVKKGSAPQTTGLHVTKQLPLQLLDFQVDHTNRLIYMLSNSIPLARDVSPTGRGKSMCEMYISQYFDKLPMVIIGKGKSIQTAWNDKFRNYSGPGPVMLNITYDDITGKGNKNKTEWFASKNNPILLRRSIYTDKLDKDGNRIRKDGKVVQDRVDEFRATQYLIDIIMKGALFVFDESHMFKNKSSIVTKAVGTIVKIIMNLWREGGSPSLVTFLSATPMDNEEQVVSFLRTIGVISRDAIYELAMGTQYAEGYTQEVIRFAHTMYRNATGARLQEILEEFDYPIDSNYELIDANKIVYAFDTKRSAETSIKRMIYEIFFDCIAPCMTSSMPGSNTSVYRGFFELDVNPGTNHSRNYAIAVEALAGELAKMGNAKKKTASERKDVFKMITYYLREMEAECIDAMVKFHQVRLETDPLCKVVGAFSFKENMYKYIEKMRDEGYDVAEIHGDIKDQAVREANRRRFQGGWYEGNWYGYGACRVCAMTAEAGGTGIDLHDISDDGNVRKRILCMTPTYKLITLYQTAGRVKRITVNQKYDTDGNPIYKADGLPDYTETESVCEVYVFFGIGRGGRVASSILRNLYKRSFVLKRAITDTFTMAGEQKRIFPGEYPRFLEGIGFVKEINYITYDEDLKSDTPMRTEDLIALREQGKHIDTIEGPMDEDTFRIYVGGESSSDILQGNYDIYEQEPSGWGTSPTQGWQPTSLTTPPTQGWQPQAQAQPWQPQAQPWQPQAQEQPWQPQAQAQPWQPQAQAQPWQPQAQPQAQAQPWRPTSQLGSPPPATTVQSTFGNAPYGGVPVLPGAQGFGQPGYGGFGPH